jgi:hypothetical protein
VYAVFKKKENMLSDNIILSLSTGNVLSNTGNKILSGNMSSNNILAHNMASDNIILFDVTWHTVFFCFVFFFLEYSLTFEEKGKNSK